MIDTKQLKVIQVCDVCGKETSFLQGVFMTAHIENPPSQVELFFCENCYPAENELQKIVKAKLQKNKLRGEK